MPSREILDSVKRATVALAVMHEGPHTDPKKAPFTVVGTGFCVHPRGVIVTCGHVISAFLEHSFEQLIARVPDEDKKKELWPLREARMIRPHALFFDTQTSKRYLLVWPVPMECGISKTDCDLGLLRVTQHQAFPSGYPTLQVEDYEEVHEGMEVATCGFPLGNYLQEQLGTITSSFTRGILSSIIPSPGAPRDYVRGFQLDLTATFGNSGGPVFTWSNGTVFGVLQGGAYGLDGNILPGIARAEPVYAVVEEEILSRLLTLKPEHLGVGER